MVTHLFTAMSIFYFYLSLSMNGDTGFSTNVPNPIRNSSVNASICVTMETNNCERILFIIQVPRSCASILRFPKSSYIVKDRSISMYISTDMKLGGWTLTVKFLEIPGRSLIETLEGSTGKI